VLSHAKPGEICGFKNTTRRGSLGDAVGGEASIVSGAKSAVESSAGFRVGRVIPNALWFENPERRVTDNAPYLEHKGLGSAAQKQKRRGISRGVLLKSERDG
jgi:hypothetical protein